MAVYVEVPRQAMNLLLMQRSGYRSRLSRFISGRLLSLLPRKFGRQLTQNVLLPIESKLFGASINTTYNSDLREDFENISKYLSQNATRVLDIGSELGGINALTYGALKTKPEIWLLDKEGVSKDWNAGFHKSASTFSHYNSFDAGGQMLTGAGIPKAKINFVNISEQPFPNNKTFDIVYSFISWGFHYPLETYSEQVKKSLSEDGVLIVDTRRGTTDVEKVSVIFDRPAKIILEGSHVQRFLISKSARN